LVPGERGSSRGVAHDPNAAFAAASAAVQADLDDPERRVAGFEGFAGPTTFEEAVDRFLSFDLVVHGWDLAKATGQEAHIPDEDVAGALDSAKAFGPALRSPGVMGPELEAPPDADEQTKLLAFLGRQA
jgi:uncharacterized protein (TIGR03086 family)